MGCGPGTGTAPPRRSDPRLLPDDMALPERPVLLGGVRQQPVLQAAGVPVGVVTAVMLCWGADRIAAQRLADRGSELMDLLRVGQIPE